MDRMHTVSEARKEKAGLKLVGIEQGKKPKSVEQFCILLCVRTFVIWAVSVAFLEQFLSVMTLSIERSWLYPALASLALLGVLLCMGVKRKWVLTAALACYGAIIWLQRQIVWMAIRTVNQQLVHLQNNNYARTIWNAQRTQMIQSLQQGVLLVMVGVVLLFTVVMVWGKGRIAAGICMLFPMVVIAIVTSFPSKQSFLGMLITGGVYFSVLCCKEGTDGLKMVLITGSVFVMLCAFSDFAGNYIFANRMESGSTYLQTRNSLQAVVDRIAEGRYARYIPGSTDHLKEMERFEPESGVERTVVVDTQPVEPVYYREEAGGEYTGEEWRMVSMDLMGTEAMFYEYPQELERLAALCTDAVGGAEPDVSRLIDYVLISRTKYTREPGPTPENWDFAEYFLFENQKGFCVHYATTATLMYRICGIPARYVSGYRIPAENFSQQEDGRWSAEALGSMGHAWSEVYVGDAWEVREHTYSDLQGSFEDLPEEQSVETPQEQEPKEEAQTPQEQEPKEEKETQDSAGILKGLGERFGAEGYVTLIRNVLILIGVFALFWFLLCLQCRARYLKKRNGFRQRKGNMGIQRIYRNLYAQAVFMGMSKSEPIDRNTVQNMKQYAENVTEEEWTWIYDTVQKALFSGEELPVEYIRRMEQLNRRYGKEIYGKLSRLRKISYRWIKCL